MTWQNPKIDWAPNNAIGTVDMNRIEGNAANRRGYIDGFILSWNTGSYLINISPGMVCINDFTYMMITGMTKSINGTWVLGAGLGGRAAGVALTDNTWYHFFVLGKANGNLEFAFDTSNTGANIAIDAAIIAAGFTTRRRIGSLLWLNTTSYFRRWSQIGDNFMIAGIFDPVGFIEGIRTFYLRYDTDNESSPLTLPPGIPVIANVKVNNLSQTCIIKVRHPNLGTEFVEPMNCKRENSFIMHLSDSSVEIELPALSEESLLVYCNNYYDSRGKDN